jgi:hypothetical protein
MPTVRCRCGSHPGVEVERVGGEQRDREAEPGSAGHEREHDICDRRRRKQRERDERARAEPIRHRSPVPASRREWTNGRVAAAACCPQLWAAEP